MNNWVLGRFTSFYDLKKEDNLKKADVLKEDNLRDKDNLKKEDKLKGNLKHTTSIINTI